MYFSQKCKMKFAVCHGRKSSRDQKYMTMSGVLCNSKEFEVKCPGDRRKFAT